MSCVLHGMEWRIESVICAVSCASPSRLSYNTTGLHTCTPHGRAQHGKSLFRGSTGQVWCQGSGTRLWLGTSIPNAYQQQEGGEKIGSKKNFVGLGGSNPLAWAG
jgi:hypothetical protein